MRIGFSVYSVSLCVQFSSLRDSDLEYKHTLYMISRIESLHLHVTWKSCTCWCTEPTLNAVFSCHTEFSSTTLYLHSHKKYVMERSDPFLKRKNNCYHTQYSMQGKLYPVVWHGAWKNVECPRDFVAFISCVIYLPWCRTAWLTR